MRYDTIVPYDFSETADAALAWASDLVRTTGGTLHVIHVVALPTASYELLPAALPYPSEKDMADAQAQLFATLARQGIEASARVVTAPHVGEAILAFARESNASLIVMGTHGRGGMSRAVLGSASDYVVRHADCPVVAIRAKHAKPAP